MFPSFQISNHTWDIDSLAQKDKATSTVVLQKVGVDIIAGEL